VNSDPAKNALQTTSTPAVRGTASDKNRSSVHIYEGSKRGTEISRHGERVAAGLGAPARQARPPTQTHLHGNRHTQRAPRKTPKARGRRHIRRRPDSPVVDDHQPVQASARRNNQAPSFKGTPPDQSRSASRSTKGSPHGKAREVSNRTPRCRRQMGIEPLQYGAWPLETTRHRRCDTRKARSENRRGRRSRFHGQHACTGSDG